MKLHSVTDIITNSSTVVFTVRTDLTEEEFELKLREIYASVSHLPFPFTRILKIEGGYEFDAGYYWGFSGAPDFSFKNERDEYGAKEEQRFKNALVMEFRFVSDEEVG